MRYLPSCVLYLTAMLLLAGIPEEVASYPYWAMFFVTGVASHLAAFALDVMR